MKKNIFLSLALSCATLFTMSLSAQNLTIEGLIETEQGQGIHGVTVTLRNAMNEVVASMVADGAYAFNNLSAGTYTVQASKTDYPLNGVSTFDVVLTSRHILGIQPLGSPYKTLAADANNDKKITTIDLVIARTIILAMIEEFPDGQSWRFVNSDWTFPSPTNPWLGIEGISNTVTLTTSNGGINFIGLKTFDVNNSADPEN